MIDLAEVDPIPEDVVERTDGQGYAPDPAS